MEINSFVTHTQRGVIGERQLTSYDRVISFLLLLAWMAWLAEWSLARYFIKFSSPLSIEQANETELRSASIDTPLPSSSRHIFIS